MSVVTNLFGIRNWCSSENLMLDDLRAGDSSSCNLEQAYYAVTCLLSSHLTVAATELADPTSSVSVSSYRYLHRTFLVKSGTPSELYPVRFKSRPEHWCHLIPVKVRIFSGLERQATEPCPSLKGRASVALPE